MWVVQVRPALRSSNETLAASMALASCRRSTTESASVRAATSIPLRPMIIPACAVACQEWAAVPGTYVAAVKESVGTFQLTRSEEHTSELQSLRHLVCRLL